MKKIGLFILLLLFVTACTNSEKISYGLGAYDPTFKNICSATPPLTCNKVLFKDGAIDIVVRVDNKFIASIENITLEEDKGCNKDSFNINGEIDKDISSEYSLKRYICNFQSGEEIKGRIYVNTEFKGSNLPHKDFIDIQGTAE